MMKCRKCAPNWRLVLTRHLLCHRLHHLFQLHLFHLSLPHLLPWVGTVLFAATLGVQTQSPRLAQFGSVKCTAQALGATYTGPRPVRVASVACVVATPLSQILCQRLLHCALHQFAMHASSEGQPVCSSPNCSSPPSLGSSRYVVQTSVAHAQREFVCWLLCFHFLPFVTASSHDASKPLARYRFRVGESPPRTSSSFCQVAKGGSAATGSAWQTKATAGWSSDRGSFVKTFSVGSPQRASTGNSSSSHSKGVENQGINGRTPSGKCQFCKLLWTRPNAKPQCRPPVDHQIKATEDFDREGQEAEAKSLAEAEELLQRLVQVPEVPQVPRSVQEFEKLVIRHDVVINEAQEALQKAESMKSAFPSMVSSMVC